jgi:hypothetical protein
MGFRRILLPKSSVKGLTLPEGVSISPVEDLRQALEEASIH